MTSFYITLNPLEPYFFGSERKFADGVSTTRNSYFIKSETMPSQTTLLGMLRFFLLKQADSITDNYQIDKELIGEKSFDILSSITSNLVKPDSKRKEKTQEFGIIDNIGPVFLADQDEQYYIVTPKNHQKDKAFYTPYEMIKMEADGRNDSILPKDYNGKTGLTYSYTRLADRKVFNIEELFGTTENVGIYKRAEEEGYYKKEYKYFQSFEEEQKKKKLKFAFFVSLNDESEVLKKKLPHFLKEDSVIKDIVYMGLGKSAFILEMKRKKNDFINQAANLIKKISLPEEICVYYAVSDTLLLENPQLPFAIIETGNFRHLITVEKSKDYWSRMKRSGLYQIIKPGSMFFVKEDYENLFQQIYHVENCKKMGMNCLIRN